MTVIVAERVTPGTRGLLTRWMLEVHPGVFIGTLSGRVRDALWNEVLAKRRTRAGAMLMAYRSPGEQGFVLLTAGQGSRQAFDYDGLMLLGRPVGNAMASRSKRPRAR